MFGERMKRLKDFAKIGSVETEQNQEGIPMKYTGTWHIYEMEQWDESYFNMEVQAYIEIGTKSKEGSHFTREIIRSSWRNVPNR